MIANINCDGLFVHFLWAKLSRNILGSSNVVRVSNCPSLCERVQFLRVSVNSGNAMSVQAGTLSGAHTHRCDSQSRKEEESPELRLLSFSLSLYIPNLSSILISPTKFLLAFQMLISSFVIMDLKSTIVPVPLICFFPPTFQAADRLILVSYIFLVFRSTFFGHLGMCKAKNQTYFEIARVPHCVLLIPPHFPTRALSQAASQAGTGPEGQYTSSILHNGCHLLQSH